MRYSFPNCNLSFVHVFKSFGIKKMIYLKLFKLMSFNLQVVAFFSIYNTFRKLYFFKYKNGSPLYPSANQTECALWRTIYLTNDLNTQDQLNTNISGIFMYRVHTIWHETKEHTYEWFFRYGVMLYMRAVRIVTTRSFSWLP